MSNYTCTIITVGLKLSKKFLYFYFHFHFAHPLNTHTSSTPSHTHVIIIPLQVVGTFLLLLGIFAICDSSNSEPQGGMKPLLIGFLLWGVGGSFMFNSGYAVNPARDFAPRAFTAMAGWGADVFV